MGSRLFSSQATVLGSEESVSGAIDTGGTKHLTARVTAAEHSRVVVLVEIGLEEVPRGEETITGDFGDDGRGRDDGVDGIGLRSYDEGDGREQSFELLLVGIGDPDSVDVSLLGGVKVSN